MVELYFDTAATTPLLAEVQQALIDSFAVYGNPSSLHRKGMEAERLVELARKPVYDCLGVGDGRVVFTGSGTEANLLALAGVARRYAGRGRHMVTTLVEHPSVLETCRALERDGWEMTYVAPESDGAVSVDTVLSSVRSDTVLVSVMHVNNETGAMLPVAEIGRALQANRRVLFHVDGVQAYGKLVRPAAEANADLYTFSGHKIGAPKGIGGLWIRRGLDIEPVVYGGGQQFGLRSGTENVLGVAGLAAASRVAHNALESAYDHVAALMRQLLEALQTIPVCQVIRAESSSPYVVCVSFPGLRGEVLLHALESEGLYVSTGSACSSNKKQTEGSHVLRAMGLSPAWITGALRFSLGRWHTEDDVIRAAEIVSRQVEQLRGILAR